MIECVQVWDGRTERWTPEEMALARELMLSVIRALIMNEELPDVARKELDGLRGVLEDAVFFAEGGFSPHGWSYHLTHISNFAWKWFKHRTTVSKELLVNARVRTAVEALDARFGYLMGARRS